MEQKGDCADSTTTHDYHKYFNELLQEMRQMNRMRSVQPETFGHAATLLTAEITRVWETIFIKEKATTEAEETKETTEPHQQPAPPSLHQDQQQEVQLEEKIPFPPSPTGHDERGRRRNLIGRILGPNGLSVKQLEAETACEILIRGNGSIKDPARQSRLLGQPGWEHLKEPLHVIIKAKDVCRENCQQKLAKATKIINTLMSTGNDEYKKQQLVQLAIMKGTYRPEKARRFK